MSLLPGEVKDRTTPFYVDCGHDTLEVDVAYHSIREDKILWPLEA